MLPSKVDFHNLRSQIVTSSLKQKNLITLKNKHHAKFRNHQQQNFHNSESKSNFRF
jgi:hypothetical protein